jgi:toxin ParE1/3/4
MTEERRWVVRLTAAAEADYQNIIAWTLEQFGDLQARVYADTLSTALAELAAGPAIVGAKERSEIGKGLFTLHVARGGRKGRHFVLFRIEPDRAQSRIEVLRLLHDAMDLKLQTPGT